MIKENLRQKVILQGFLILLLPLLSDCMLLPVFRNEPVLPAVNGTVVDADTGKPIEGAVITWSSLAGKNGPRAVSDPEGRFYLETHSDYVRWRIIAMDSGIIQKLTVTKEGYRTGNPVVGAMGVRATDTLEAKITLHRE